LVSVREAEELDWTRLELGRKVELSDKIELLVETASGVEAGYSGEAEPVG
jgi:hypothetical protein